MSFSLPTEIPVITEDELNVLERCVEVREGYLYFHRMENPTRATAYHGIHILRRHLTDTSRQILLYDLTAREMVSHAQMRYMIEQVKLSDLYTLVAHLIIVLDGNPFRRVAANFFLNIFFRNRSTQVYLCQTIADAELLAEQLVREFESVV